MKIWILYLVLVSSNSGEEIDRQPLAQFDDAMECLTELGRQPIQHSSAGASKYFKCVRADTTKF